MCLEDKEAQITRNAMLVYPFIKSGVMSHGKAAEMLGLHKIGLIILYGKYGGNPISPKWRISLSERYNAATGCRVPDDMRHPLFHISIDIRHTVFNGNNVMSDMRQVPNWLAYHNLIQCTQA